MHTSPQKKSKNSILPALGITIIASILILLILNSVREIQRSYSYQHDKKESIEKEIAYGLRRDPQFDHRPLPSQIGDYNCYKINAGAWENSSYKCTKDELTVITISNVLTKTLYAISGLIYLLFAPVIFLFIMNLALHTFLTKKYQNLNKNILFLSLLLVNTSLVCLFFL